MKLDIRAFAIAVAVVWGLGVFIMTWWIIAFDGPSDNTTFISQLYRGYTITPFGSLIGLAWAVVDGLIVGAVFAWVYNFFVSAKRTSG